MTRPRLAHGWLAALLILACPAPTRADHLDAKVLIVSGLGGEATYSQQFHEWALQMRTAVVEQLGLAAADVRWLCEQPARDPGNCAAQATRVAVLDALREMLNDPGEQRPLLVVLIGHGTHRDGRALFNVAGPDLAASDLHEVFSAAESAVDASARDAHPRSIAVVNTTPASAAFARALAGPGRIVVTATARSAENDHTRFAAHFVGAYTSNAADADRDGRVSLLEAFVFAAREVAREYAQKRQLSTEHATLEDNGDGQASREPGVGAGGGDGAAAANFFVAAAVRHENASAQRVALEAEARELVARINALRARKPAMKTIDYEQALESLLVELAHNRQRVREQGS